jgi:hypothetical protein
LSNALLNGAAAQIALDFEGTRFARLVGAQKALSLDARDLNHTEL